MDHYKWILAFHIIALMSWMAMLFYLPRLFVYHVEHAEKKEFVEVVKIQEYKIYKYIGLPAFWATLANHVGAGRFALVRGGRDHFIGHELGALCLEPEAFLHRPSLAYYVHAHSD